MSERAPVWRRLRERARSSPDLVDALVAVVVFVTVLAPLLAEDVARAPVRLAATPEAVALLAAGCAALAVRRRACWSVWAATTVLGVLACAEAGTATPVYVPAVIALATVAAHSRVSRTMLATLVTALLPAAVIAAVGDQGLVDSFAFGLTPWSGGAAMAGIAVRNQRAVVTAALERAAAAEARQEEEAQRRVAEERLRIARDLHDVVAHHIAVVNVQAGVAQHLLRTDPDRALEALRHVREASRTVLDEVPDLLGLLRTTEDEEPTAPTPTLAQAGELVEQARRSGLDVTVRTTGSPAHLTTSADVAAYRVLQESLTNAARHGTGRVEVEVRHGDGGCRLLVVNPRPRDADAPAGPGTVRHGLVGMTERVAAAGGSITAGPSGSRHGEDGHDWVVDVWLPADRVERVP